MTKYHNGPNGPGICKAKKGNCPFGGEDSHFSTKKESEIVYEREKEKEYGLLPGVSKDSKVDTRETKIQSYNGRGNPLASSNFVSSSGQGSKADGEYFVNKLKNSDMNSEQMVESLNNDKKIFGQWKVKSETGDNITLSSEDTWGNKHFVDVKKVEPPKPKVAPRGHMITYNSHGMQTSPANYVSLGKGGTQESRDYFEGLVKDSNLDPDKLVKTLNDDKRVFGKWEFDMEDDTSLHLKNTDTIGNVNFLKINK